MNEDFSDKFMEKQTKIKLTGIIFKWYIILKNHYTDIKVIPLEFCLKCSELFDKVKIKILTL